MPPDDLARVDDPLYSCGSCAFYRRNPQTIGAGVCVCMPPLVIGVTQNGVPSMMPVRPPVRAADTCGQWKMTSPFSPQEAPNG